MSDRAQAVRRQIVWLAAALAAGAAPLFFIYAERAGEDLLRFAAGWSPWLPAAMTGVGMLVICRLRDLVFPGTEGTGIPQAIAALRLGETPARERLLSLRIAAGKILLLTLGLLTGQTIGREGPSVHVSACFLYRSARFARFPDHLVQRGLILAGGAAGIGAAFNTPLAALIFACEEIGRSFEKENAGTIVRTVIVACLLCWVPLGDYLFYGALDTGLGSAAEWAVVPVVGLAGGLVGGAFARAVAESAGVVRRWSARHPYRIGAGLGLALAALALVSDGTTQGGGYLHARQILVAGADLPLAYPFTKAVATFLSLVSAIPGGLFDPSLSVGAGLGQLAWPLAPHVDRQAFVLLAMAAYFAGVVQSPITAAVILVEMTDANDMLLPLLAASVLAYTASRRLCRPSLYEALSLTFLPEKPRA